MRQSLPAVFGGSGNEAPAAVDIFLVRVLEALRRRHRAVAPFSAFDIAAAINRRKHIAGKFAGLLEDRVDQVGRDFLAARQFCDALDADDVFQDEGHVLQRCTVLTHGMAFLGKVMSRGMLC